MPALWEAPVTVPLPTQPLLPCRTCFREESQGECGFEDAALLPQGWYGTEGLATCEKPPSAPCILLKHLAVFQFASQAVRL